MSKDVVMGVTSGASTPDAAVQDSLGQIFLLKKMMSGDSGDAAASEEEKE
jgi:4-hydroxy-3-methylbut-2-enyl diphosphate reductase IspH